MSNESIIYKSDDLTCRLHIDGAMETTKNGPLFVFRILSSSQVSILKLEAEIHNPGTPWFWWPNKEGERGRLSEVPAKLDEHNVKTKGISVFYPVSAFSRTIIIGDEKGGIILSAIPDDKGRICSINAKSRNSENVEFTVKTGRSCWLLTQFHGSPEDALEWMTKIIDKVQWPMLPEPKPSGDYILQVGLIGPDYDCMVPADRGFMVLEDIAKVMRRHLGKGHWLHVFGYAHGHDILYPDYKPSNFMGGGEKLKEAIKAVHRQGQKVSFYLNLRIADASQVENDFKLKKAVFNDTLGRTVTEKAHDREFIVMNPESKEWQDRIVEEAERLIELGADALELNFRGHHSLMVPLGEQWGDGYRKIMSRIREHGVQIWYRGGTDLYPADWLEMSREELILEDDGHVFSGCAIGEFDPRLYTTLVPGRSFMLPLSRMDLPNLEGVHIIKDLEDIMGGLFIYNEEYMDKIEMILERAAAEADDEDAVKAEAKTAAPYRPAEEIMDPMDLLKNL